MDVFCEIALGHLPAHLVHRDGLVVAFLDTRPVFKGHVLVCPVAHVPTLLDASADELAAVMAVVQHLARALPAALGCEGSFVAVNTVVSQSVPHLHAHVVPRTKGDGLRGFLWPRTTYADPAEAESYAARIRAVG